MDAVAKTPSKLPAKLRRLFDASEMTRADIAEAIGVNKQMMTQYLSGAIPGPAVLLNIARLFNVPMEWLTDDKAGMTPPKSFAALATDEELVDELKQRYVDEAKQVRDIIAAAETIDWPALAEQVGAHEPGEQPSVELEAGLKVTRELILLMEATVRRFIVGCEPKPLPADVEPDPDSLLCSHLTARGHRMLDVVAATDRSRLAFHRWFIAQDSVFAMDAKPRIAAARAALQEYRDKAGHYRKS